MNHKQRLVVIGNGMAGARAIEEVLRCGGADSFQIAVFGEEPYGTYDRMKLPEVVAGWQSAEDILVNSPEWYADNGIRLHVGERAAVISREARRVYGADGTMEHYDKLILAVGSDPYVPLIRNMIGPARALRDGVSAFRSLNDCSRIVSLAHGSARVAVLGGGHLAIEAARGLLARGCHVQLVHRGSRLLGDHLDEGGAATLRAVLEQAGVEVHLGKSISAVLGETAVSGVEFRDGSRLDCRLVVLAMGLQPNSWIAAQCGLTVSRAIVVDDQMRSVDDGDIYALGECAEHRGEVSSLLEPIWNQARILASHLTGSDPEAAFHGATRATRLRLLGVDLASLGMIEAERPTDQVFRFPSARGEYKKLVVRDGRLVGALVLGSPEEVALYGRLFASATSGASLSSLDSGALAAQLVS